jgi:hypothetical protein
MVVDLTTAKNTSVEEAAFTHNQVLSGAFYPHVLHCNVYIADAVYLEVYR